MHYVHTLSRTPGLALATLSEISDTPLAAYTYIYANIWFACWNLLSCPTYIGRGFCTAYLALPTWGVVHDTGHFPGRTGSDMACFLQLPALPRQHQAWFRNVLPFPAPVCPYVSLSGTDFLTYEHTYSLTNVRTLSGHFEGTSAIVYNTKRVLCLESECDYRIHLPFKVTRFRFRLIPIRERDKGGDQVRCSTITDQLQNEPHRTAACEPAIRTMGSHNIVMPKEILSFGSSSSHQKLATAQNRDASEASKHYLDTRPPCASSTTS